MGNGLNAVQLHWSWTHSYSVFLVAVCQFWKFDLVLKMIFCMLCSALFSMIFSWFWSKALIYVSDIQASPTLCFGEVKTPFKSGFLSLLLPFVLWSENSNQKYCVVFVDLLIGMIGNQIKRRKRKKQKESSEQDEGLKEWSNIFFFQGSIMKCNLTWDP